MTTKQFGLRVLQCLSIAALAAGQLVGPGAVSTYSGMGSQSRGFGYVRDPAAGFFVTGSTIEKLNGVYHKVERIPATIDHQWQLAYFNDMTGWFMGLVRAPEDPEAAGYRAKGGKSSEWLFIDDKHVDRFGHEGETVIPGSGTKWEHLHRPGSQGGGRTPGQADGGAAAGAGAGAGSTTGVATVKDDQEDELPWQVIYIGDENMVNRLRHGHRWHKHNIQQAIAGAELPPMPQAPGYRQTEQQPPADLPVPAVPDAEKAFEDGDFETAAAAYGHAIQGLRAGGQPGGWPEAVFRQLKATAHRRANQFQEALAEARTALSMFPRYTKALLAVGHIHLDNGAPGDAIQAFETVLRIDRQWPGIGHWLVRAHANLKRDAAASAAGPPPGGEPTNEDLKVLATRTNHYEVLELTHDFAPSQIKRTYRRISRIYHPDKHGGSNSAFQRVTAAYDTLTDPKRRELYDEGDELPRELDRDGAQGPAHKEIIIKQYFPERFGFEPFGDPYERKRQHEQEKRDLAAPIPNAADIPVGTYQTSCLGCALIDGDEPKDTLRCLQCRNSHGNRVESQIKLNACLADEVIGNRVGVLTCEMRPQSMLPEPEVEPEVDLPEPDIEPEITNDDDGAGGDEHPDDGLPAGPYRDSCQSCTLEDHPAGFRMLKCEHCVNANGGYVPSTISADTCAREGRVIGNVNGILSCVVPGAGHDEL